MKNGVNVVKGKKYFQKTHGRSHSRIYNIWCGIKKRCCNEKELTYKYYGGRGIKICDEWKDNFQNFYDWAMANGYQENLTIDRIDFNGNYEPSNCRWITQKEQTRNYSKNHFVYFEGEKYVLKDLATKFGICRTTLQDRLKRGMSIEEALVLRDYRNKNVVKPIANYYNGNN